MKKKLGTNIALSILTGTAFVSLLVLIFISSFHAKNVPADHSYPLTAGDLTNAELQRETALANKNDGEAAFRLFLYYGISKQEVLEGNKWLKRSADLGYGPAKEGFQGLLPGEQKQASEAAAASWPNTNQVQK